MRIRQATAAEARGQAPWIVAIEPWRSMGYKAESLGTWLARRARQQMVWVAVEQSQVVGIMVSQPEVLLGHFIALVAVSPLVAGRGIGRALVEHAAKRAFRRSRWLYTSSDTKNLGAARFYRRLGFEPIGRLPGLVTAGRVEVLWRRARTVVAAPRRAPSRRRRPGTRGASA